MRTLSSLIFLLTILTSGALYAQRITVTLAGNGTQGYAGDGHPAHLSETSSPTDVAIDAQKNIYFVDAGNFRIRKIAAKTGMISTVAGGGTSTADGVPATDAVISPEYLCIAANGDLFFSNGTKISKVSGATGFITTVAGGNTAGSFGDGGPATAALLDYPQGVCVNTAGDLYVADQGNNKIRKIEAATGIINTVADGASAPIAICVNPAGDVYFSDLYGTYIKKIAAGSGVVSILAGTGDDVASGNGGPASSAAVGLVNGLCVDASGNLYLTDLSCSCREINMSTGIIDIVAGNFGLDGYNGDGLNSLLIWFNEPKGIITDASGTIYTADWVGNRIRKSIFLTHTPSFTYGKGQQINPCPGTSFSLNSLVAIADIDSAQTESWTVIANPANGTLSGFPYSTGSTGTASLTTPVGLTYTPIVGFSGNDSFRVRVSDGALSDTITIYVSVPVSLPSPGIISGLPDSICFDGSVLPLSETVPGGLWTITNNNAIIYGDGNLHAAATGPDTVTYTVIDGCTVSTTASFYIRIGTAAGMIAGADSINSGTSTVLIDSVPGGIWLSNDPSVASISSTGVVNAVSPGTAYLEYYVPGPCATDTAYFMITVLDGTRVNTIGTNNYELAVAPNPVKTLCTFTVSAPIDEPVTFTISNMLGEKIKVIRGATNEPVNALLDIASGIYLLNAITKHGSLTCKILKE